MGEKNMQGKYAGVVRVGDKGQIVIPKAVRDLFGIMPGDTLLLLADQERGIAMKKGDQLYDLIDQLTHGDAPEKGTDQ